MNKKFLDLKYSISCVASLLVLLAMTELSEAFLPFLRLRPYLAVFIPIPVHVSSPADEPVSPTEGKVHKRGEIP